MRLQNLADAVKIFVDGMMGTEEQVRQNMVVEGEEGRAFVTWPSASATRTSAWAQKADGTPVLEASASVGPDHGPTLLEQRMAQLRPPERLIDPVGPTRRQAAD